VKRKMTFSRETGLPKDIVEKVKRFSPPMGGTVEQQKQAMEMAAEYREALLEMHGSEVMNNSTVDYHIWEDGVCEFILHLMILNAPVECVMTEKELRRTLKRIRKERKEG